MTALERAGLWALRQMDPETAHGWAIWALRRGLAPVPRLGPVTSPRLATQIAGLDLPSPVGIAAGFDKHAHAVDATLATGPGFIEVGGVAPRPQSGNPRPRLFRLSDDRAVINRFGFNTLGQDAVLANLRQHRCDGIVGVNLGANKDTEDKTEDYIAVMTAFAQHVAFATINVSSPNTEKLRDLQGRAALDAVLTRVIAARDALPQRVPLFLKIAPDLTDAEIADIAEIAVTRGMDAIIATNTTLARNDLTSPHASQQGGLSGAPLFAQSTAVLRRLYQETGGKIPLIGVGGIASAEQAYAKIRAGASAVQLYSALVYQGLSLVRRIAEDLDTMLARDGVASITDAVGVDA